MKARLLTLSTLLLFFFASCGNNKNATTSQVAEATLKVAEPEYGMMIIATLSIKADKIKDFTDVAKAMIESSNKEPGCQSYQLYQDPYENTKFVFVEQYKNQAAVDQHFAADYFKAFGPKIGDLVASPANIRIISMAKEVVK